MALNYYIYLDVLLNLNGINYSFVLILLLGNLDLIITIYFKYAYEYFMISCNFFILLLEVFSTIS